MISSKIDVDGILTRLQGRKGRAFDEAWDELLQLAETVDAVQQPEINRKNEEAKRNRVPGESYTVSCEPAWAHIIGHYVEAIRNKRMPDNVREGSIRELKRMAAYAMKLAGE